MHLFILFLTVLPFVLSSKYGFDTTLQRPAVPDLNPAPPSTTLRRSIYKQATRKSILARKEHKAKLAERERNKHVERTLVERATTTTAATPSATATVYPSCTANTTASYIANTGFANLSPWYIPRTAGYNVVGNWADSKTLLECVALCQQQGGNCKGVFWDSTQFTCTQRYGIPVGANWSTQTAGVMAVRGTCSQIAAIVQNATVMANCCDNTPTVSMCSASGYQNIGNVCVKSPLQLSGDQLSARNVSAPTPAQGYANCLAACQNASTTAYTNAVADAQCLGVMYDSTRSLNSSLNCYLQGNKLSSMTVSTTNTNLISFMSGFCQQQNYASGPYSSAYRGVSGCDSQQPTPP